MNKERRCCLEDSLKVKKGDMEQEQRPRRNTNEKIVRGRKGDLFFFCFVLNDGRSGVLMSALL